MHEARIMKLVIFNGFSIYINTHTHTYIYISDFFFLNLLDYTIFIIEKDKER